MLLIITGKGQNATATCTISNGQVTTVAITNSGYGYDALIIGGRFEANDVGLKNLNNIFKFQAKNYQNIYYNFNDVLLRLIKKIFNLANKFYQR